MNKSKIMDKLLLLFIIATILLFLLNANRLQTVITDTGALWFNGVFPSLFIFFTATSFLIKSNIISPSSSRGIYLLSLLSGAPVSTKCVCEMYQLGGIGKNEAQALLGISSTASAGFILGVVGTTFFRSEIIGVLLLASSFISALLTYFLAGKNSINFKRKAHTNKETQKSLSFAFCSSIKDSLFAVLNIGAYMIVFSVFIEVIFIVLSYFNVGTSTVLRLIVSGIFEITISSELCSSLFNQYPLLATLLCSMILNFGGICAFFQGCEYITQTDLSVSRYLISKCIQSVISAVIYGGLYLTIYDNAVTTSMTVEFTKINQNTYGNIIVYVILFMIVIISIEMKYNKGNC